MLSLASFGMVSNPQAELGVPDMRPRNNEAKILMEMAQCAVWCSSNVASWDSKCQWDSGYCAACAECSAVSTPHCGYWCDMHSGSWAESTRRPPHRPDPRGACVSWHCSLSLSRLLYGGEEQTSAWGLCRRDRLDNV